jgi:hypothetical protein
MTTTGSTTTGCSRRRRRCSGDCGKRSSGYGPTCASSRPTYVDPTHHPSVQPYIAVDLLYGLRAR